MSDSTARPLPDPGGNCVSMARKVAHKSTLTRLVALAGRYAAPPPTWTVRTAGVALSLLLGLAVLPVPAQVQPSAIDLSLHKTGSRRNPAIGDALAYGSLGDYAFSDVRPEGTRTYPAVWKFGERLSDPPIISMVNRQDGDCSTLAGTLIPVNATICSDAAKTIVISATTAKSPVQPPGYSTIYVLTKGAGLVFQQTSVTPSFTVPATAADYTIHTMVYHATPGNINYLDLSSVKPGLTTAADIDQLIANQVVCADLDIIGAKVTVNQTQPPVLTVSSQAVCYGATVVLSAAGCEGGIVNWSDGSAGASIEKTIYGNLSVSATCTVNGCPGGPSQTVHVTPGAPGIPTIAGSHPTVCSGETVTLTATGCEGGTYIWSDDKTTGSILTVTPTADVSYRVKCAVGACEGSWSAYTTLNVATPNSPTITIGGSGATTVCYGALVTLTARGCPTNDCVTWSNELVGTSITVSLTKSRTYTARCCTSTNCRSETSNPIAITVLPEVGQPVTIDRTNACPSTTVNLATGVTGQASTTGGVFEFYTSSTLSSESKVADPTTAGAGTYYVVEKTVSGCTGLPALIHVLITTCSDVQPCNPQNPATANAGADAGICAAKSYQLSGLIGGAGKTGHWSSSGNGTFDDPFAPNAIYTASADDVLAGTVTLTLSVSTNNTACAVAKDNMVLTIDGNKSIPAVTAIGSANLCYGDSVTLKAPAGAGYLWSTKAGTQQIVVKTGGAYSVQLIDGKGCSSVKSAEVVVTVGKPVPTPLVANLRNICPAIVANLARSLTDGSAGGSYEYRIGPLASSALVMRPDSVGAGTYYVFGKSRDGCSSAAADVTVKIVNCAADTLTTDVGIFKTVSKASVRSGETVTYTIRVTNFGKHGATNIEIRDNLPKGLELVPDPAADYDVSNGVIVKHVNTLAAGESRSISFAAHVIAKGLITNQANIVYTDQKDTNIGNNSSKVTVQNTTVYKHSLMGLAKSVLGTPKAVGDSLIKVSYSFVLTNFGDDTLRKVQVTDDLAYFFVPNTVVGAVVTPKTAGSTLVLDPAFTGRGSNTALFDSASYVVPGHSQLFTLVVMVKRAAGNTTRAFRNIASVTAQNSVTAVYDLSADGGDSDPDGDGDPTNNSSFSGFTLGAEPPAGPGIGLALAVVKVQKQADGSYNVTYRATIKNTGNVPLFGVGLTDNLIRAFAAPVSYSVVGGPVVRAGSNLVANAGFNGNAQPDLLTNASTLAAGEQDTLLVTVNVAPNGSNGPFVSTATAIAHTADAGQTVKDISNNGFDPTSDGAASTTLRFDLPTGLLGVSKSVGTPTLVEAGVYDIPYTITLSNVGSVPLKKIQVVDNFSQTFRHGALIVSNRIALTTTTGLTVDSLYTGQGLITKMLVDSRSNLPVGATSTLAFTVRVNVKNADSLTFYNTATATALTNANEVVVDISTAGINNDPDNDLDPRNNSTPTPVSLNSLSANGYIGVAMAVRDTIRQTDGSFNVTYQIVVKNYGRDLLTKVSLTDSLSKVFNPTTGAAYTIVKAPFTTSTGSALTLNPTFDGASDARIVLGDSLSRLAAGKTETILVMLNVSTNGSTTTFLNSAYAEAKSGTVTVSDVSTSGLNPDLNGNGNPTDLNERESTPLNLPSTGSALFIPQGFSPNGDGINDLFVIRGVGNQTVSLEIYNRWGHLVYRNDDYKNDWDGKPNTGITISGDGGLPDGTYYYVIKTSDGRKFVRYMTINR